MVILRIAFHVPAGCAVGLQVDSGMGARLKGALDLHDAALLEFSGQKRGLSDTTGDNMSMQSYLTPEQIALGDRLTC